MNTKQSVPHMLAILVGLVLAGCETTSPTSNVPLALSKDSGYIPGPLLSRYPREDVEYPQTISREAPEYPFELRRGGVSGAVTVKFDILPSGETAGIEVIESPHPRLAEAALAAVAKWRFTPAKVRGQVVGVGDVIQVVEFRINEPAHPVTK